MVIVGTFLCGGSKMFANNVNIDVADGDEAITGQKVGIQTGQEELKGVLPDCQGLVEGEEDVEPQGSVSNVSASEDQPSEENVTNQNQFVKKIQNFFEGINNILEDVLNWELKKYLNIKYKRDEYWS